MSSELQLSLKPRDTEQKEPVFFLPTVAGRSQQLSHVPLWQEQLYPREQQHKYKLGYAANMYLVYTDFQNYADVIIFFIITAKAANPHI